jgi:ABC-type uncharacterized transport system permease subunit
LIGLLTALIALGMALTYRSNRFINFAQADMGTIPVVLIVMLMTAWGWPYLVAVPVGILAALAVGAIVELAVIRRFFKAPRLLITVASLGLSQLLTAIAILLPRLWGVDFPLLGQRLPAPFHLEFSIGTVVFDANDLIAMIVAPLALVGLALFLRLSSVGVAIRASADSADRASLLGVPVKRLQTLVWSVASLLAFTAIFCGPASSVAGVRCPHGWGAAPRACRSRARPHDEPAGDRRQRRCSRHPRGLDRLRCVEPAADRPHPRPGHHPGARTLSERVDARRRGRVVDMAECGRRAPDPRRSGPHPVVQLVKGRRSP